MFDRPTYKAAARAQLRGKWAFPVVMTLIVSVLMTMLGLLTKGTRAYTATAGAVYVLHQANALTVLIIGIGGILALAQTHVYLKLARTGEKATFDDFLHGLSDWLAGALGGLWFALWTFLWSLLFVIPGIVKMFSYSQMFFVLAENPGIGVRKAMDISKIITRGHKGELFAMTLSFFGWALLCALPCTISLWATNVLPAFPRQISVVLLNVGLLWLKPYMRASFLNAYFALKNTAIATNLLSPADFAPAAQGEKQ